MTDICTCKELTGELAGCIAMDCPTHDPPIQPDECECGAMQSRHKREVVGCEYHDHHCDTCHDLNACTADKCRVIIPITVTL